MTTLPTSRATRVLPGSWPWRRAALLAYIAAQLITIAALEGADTIPATWTAVLLAVAPAPPASCRPGCRSAPCSGARR